jgi:hypothetical protein
MQHDVNERHVVEALLAGEVDVRRREPRGLGKLNAVGGADGTVYPRHEQLRNVYAQVVALVVRYHWHRVPQSSRPRGVIRIDCSFVKWAGELQDLKRSRPVLTNIGHVEEQRGLLDLTRIQPQPGDRLDVEAHQGPVGRAHEQGVPVAVVSLLTGPHRSVSRNHRHSRLHTWSDRQDAEQH